MLATLHLELTPVTVASDRATSERVPDRGRAERLHLRDPQH